MLVEVNIVLLSGVAVEEEGGRSLAQIMLDIFVHVVHRKILPWIRGRRERGMMF